MNRMDEIRLRHKTASEKETGWSQEMYVDDVGYLLSLIDAPVMTYNYTQTEMDPKRGTEVREMIERIDSVRNIRDFGEPPCCCADPSSHIADCEWKKWDDLRKKG